MAAFSGLPAFPASIRNIAQRVGRITSVAAPVLATDVHDHCFRVLHLDLECSNQRVFGVHDDMVRFFLHLYADGKLQGTRQNSAPESIGVPPITLGQQAAWHRPRVGHRVRSPVALIF